MNLDQLVIGEAGQKEFLLGNEAAVRGAIEAGVSVAATYPGTPSSEIGNILSFLAKDANIYFEFSTNEKVAMEVAATAAASGIRSFTFMKHVGLNVASDSFMTTAYSGVKGGMVILTADDPSMFSSQNEQDSRYYGRLSKIPILEPSSCQEVKDMVAFGFELSEMFELPVIVRTTTRVSHMRGIVTFSDKKDNSSKGDFHWLKGNFKKNPSQFVPVPANSIVMHDRLCEKIANINKVTNESEFNQIITKNNSKYGVVTSSSAFNYVSDVIRKYNLNINILKLGLSYPFPKNKVLDFLKDLDRVFIVEEVDPIMEKEVLAVIGQNKISVNVHGKLDGSFPETKEFNPDIVKNGLNNVLNFYQDEKKQELSDDLENLINELPKRFPVLCSGCPHRAVYYAVNKAIEELGLTNDDVVFASDIGCYTLGINPPYNAADYLLSMGSSIGDGCGFSVATNQKVVSFIGDSTFFHSGLSPLVNAVHNKHNFVVTVLDNRITAMTGGQPNPGIPIDGMGDKAPEISIRKLALASGCDFVRVINPLNLKQTIETYKKALEHNGVAVIISKSPCTLIKCFPKRPAVKHVESRCTKCNKCITELVCPAISSINNKIVVDDSMCTGCNFCVQTCKYGAFEEGK